MNQDIINAVLTAQRREGTPATTDQIDSILNTYGQIHYPAGSPSVYSFRSNVAGLVAFLDAHRMVSVTWTPGKEGTWIRSTYADGYYEDLPKPPDSWFDKWGWTVPLMVAAAVATAGTIAVALAAAPAAATSAAAIEAGTAAGAAAVPAAVVPVAAPVAASGITLSQVAAGVTIAGAAAGTAQKAKNLLDPPAPKPASAMVVEAPPPVDPASALPVPALILGGALLLAVLL